MDWSFFFVNRNWMPQWFMWVLFLLSCRYFCTFIPHRTLLGFWIEGSTSSYFLLFDHSSFLLAIGLISCDPALGWPLLKPVPKRKTFLGFRTGKRFHQVGGGGTLVTHKLGVHGSDWNSPSLECLCLCLSLHILSLFVFNYFIYSPSR